jgi:hypothetical protein
VTVGVRRLLSSPRRRRRLLWTLPVIVLVVGVAVMLAFLRNTANFRETFYPGEPQVYHEPKTVALTKDELEEVHSVAVQFMESAVRRSHPEDAFDIVTPSLRQGMTIEEWKTGDIPAQPYPIDTPSAAKWKVAYQYQGDVMLAFAVLPTREAMAQGIRPMAFSMELKQLGTEKGRRWLVDSWVPLGGGSPQLTADARGGGGSGDGRPVGPVKAELSGTWLLLPLGLILSALLIPLGIGIFHWTRNRRAIRAYEAQL